MLVRLIIGGCGTDFFLREKDEKKLKWGKETFTFFILPEERCYNGKLC
jgi:hypothetical protein